MTVHSDNKALLRPCTLVFLTLVLLTLVTWAVGRAGLGGLGLSLTVLVQALPELTLTLAKVSAQRRVRRLQLVPLQVHDGSSGKTHFSRLGPGPSLKPSREPESAAAARCQFTPG